MLSDMTNEKLITELDSIDPMSAGLSDLLIEMWRRELVEAELYGRRLLGGDLFPQLEQHPDDRLYDVVEILTGCFASPCDAETWLALSGYEQRICDVLMTIAARHNPCIGFEVLGMLDNEDRRYAPRINVALLSIVRSIPIDTPDLIPCLQDGLNRPDVTPDTRAAIIRRLADQPRTPETEDYFVHLYVRDNRTDQSITDAINEALERHTN